MKKKTIKLKINRVIIIIIAIIQIQELNYWGEMMTESDNASCAVIESCPNAFVRHLKSSI